MEVQVTTHMEAVKHSAVMVPQEVTIALKSTEESKILERSTLMEDAEYTVGTTRMVHFQGTEHHMAISMIAFVMSARLAIATKCFVRTSIIVQILMVT